MTGLHLSANGFCTGLGAMALASGLGLGLIRPPAAHADTATAPVVEVRGRQYVDPYGCVFLRATISGKRTWLPLLGADDKPVCGQTPSSGTKAAGVVQAPAPEPAKPSEPLTAPAAAPAPAPKAAVTASATADAAAPKADANAPAALPEQPATLEKPLDPAKPSAPEPSAVPPKPQAPAPQTTAAQITAAQRWIQIGAFADQANADALHRRLIAEGWSVGQAPIMGGKMTVVLVGPFAKPADLRAALVRLQALGFATAFAR